MRQVQSILGRPNEFIKNEMRFMVMSVTKARKKTSVSEDSLHEDTGSSRVGHDKTVTSELRDYL